MLKYVIASQLNCLPTQFSLAPTTTRFKRYLTQVCHARWLSLTLTSDSLAVARFLLVIVTLVVVLLLVFPSLGLLIFFSEPSVQVLIWFTVAGGSRTLRARGLAATGIGHSIAPRACRFPGVHLREQKTKHRFAIGPVQVVELHSNLLLRLRGALLALVVLLREFASRLYQRQEFWLLVTLVGSQFRFHLATLLLLDLLHGFKEELLDVGALV